MFLKCRSWNASRLSNALDVCLSWESEETLRSHSEAIADIQNRLARLETGSGILNPEKIKFQKSGKTLTEILGNLESEMEELRQNSRSSIVERPRKPVTVELETPSTELVITPRTVRLSLADNDLRAQLCLVMMKRPSEVWALSAIMSSLEQHGWGNAKPNIVKALRELVGLGLVEIVHSGARIDYRLVKEKIRITENARTVIEGVDKTAKSTRQVA